MTTKEKMQKYNSNRIYKNGDSFNYSLKKKEELKKCFSEKEQETLYVYKEEIFKNEYEAYSECYLGSFYFIKKGNKGICVEKTRDNEIKNLAFYCKNIKDFKKEALSLYRLEDEKRGCCKILSLKNYIEFI